MSENEKMLAKAPKERSPAYPAISLKVAIDRLERFDNKFKRHAAPFRHVGTAWGFTAGSSQSNTIMAALKSYGLIQYEGSGNNRKVTISEEGRTYLRAQQDEIKKGVIRRAALKPKAIAMFWPMWGVDRPIDDICLDELILKHSYNSRAAPVFLRVYDETIAYAGLTDSDKNTAEVDQIPDEDGERLVGASVGDLVQWEIDGVLQLQQPAQVLSIQENGEWVFVEGSNTGIPMNQIRVETKRPPAPIYPVAPVAPPPPITAKGEGEQEWVRTPLGKGVFARILVTEELSDPQIEKLRLVLQAMKEGE